MTVGDAPLLERWQAPDFVGDFNRFGIPPHPLRAAIQDHGLITDQGGTLMVERTSDGTPLGTVSWRSVHYGPNPESLAWNIGINLVPAGRGHGYGAEAQRLLAVHLFATTSVKRIEAMTDADNLAEQRALERAGFAREGVLRRAQFRAGSWHDLVVYAVVRPT